MSLIYETETAALPAIDACAGLVSGFAGVCVSQPFDTVRVRTQVMQRPVMQTFYGTVEAGVAVGLYRGVVPALCATTLVSTTVFTSLEFSKRTLSTLRDATTPTRAPLIDTFLSGCFAGTIVSMLTTPLHRIKVQLQARDSPAGRVTGHTVRAAASCFRLVLQKEGLRGLYLGWRTQSLSETLGRGVYFGTYEMCKRTFWLEGGSGTGGGTGSDIWRSSSGARDSVRDNLAVLEVHVPQEIQEIPLYGRFLSGAASGVVGWTVIYPVDVVKNRIQAQLVSTNVKATWIEITKQLYRQSGILAFYRGWSVVAVRALPVSSVALPTYDLVHKELSKRAHFY